MGAKNDLTEEERIRILTLHGEGYSRRNIQDVVPRSLGAIQRCITQHTLGIATKRPGRHPCVSDRDRRRVIREVSNKRTSSAKVKARLELTCSARTIRNIIKASGIIRWKKLSKKPLLSHTHRERRMAFAGAKLTWRTPANAMEKIIFSDEKKFNLDGPDGNAFYYHDERKQEILRNRRQGGGKSVMIWAAIGFAYYVV
jgi:transposase